MSLEAEINKSNRLATVILVVYVAFGIGFITLMLVSICTQHIYMEELFQALQQHNVTHADTKEDKGIRDE